MCIEACYGESFYIRHAGAFLPVRPECERCLGRPVVLLASTHKINHALRMVPERACHRYCIVVVAAHLCIELWWGVMGRARRNCRWRRQLCGYVIWWAAGTTSLLVAGAIEILLNSVSAFARADNRIYSDALSVPEYCACTSDGVSFCGTKTMWVLICI